MMIPMTIAMKKSNITNPPDNMTVKQLKEELSKYPDNMEVFMAERKTEFTYGLLNSVTSNEIAFMESPGDEPLSRDTVVILDEE